MKTNLGQITPVFVEKAIGNLVAPNAIASHGGLDPDAKLQAYIAGVGAKLAAQSPRQGDIEYTFQALASDKIINAYALGNGNVFITRGLLNILDNEAQLAYILGHETGHVAKRHIAKQLDISLGGLAILAIGTSLVKRLQALKGDEPAPEPAPAKETTDARQVALSLIVNGFSRRHELEADDAGIKYSAGSGYDPYAAVATMGKLKQLEGEVPPLQVFFRSHPLATDRIDALEERIKASFPTSGGNTNVADYRENVFGDTSGTDEGSPLYQKFGWLIPTFSLAGILGASYFLWDIMLPKRIPKH